MNDSALSLLLGLAFAWRRAEIRLEFGGTPVPWGRSGCCSSHVAALDRSFNAIAESFVSRLQTRIA